MDIENAKEVSHRLRGVQEKYKSIIVSTCEIDVSAMARDAADAIDMLIENNTSTGSIKINFKKCCGECRARKIYVNNCAPIIDDKQLELFTMIGCEHEKVCGAYQRPNEGEMCDRRAYSCDPILQSRDK